MNDDFGTLYISSDLNIQNKYKYADIFGQVAKYIESKGVHLITESFQDGKGNHKKSFIESIVCSQMRWRIIISLQYFDGYKRIFLALSPEFQSNIYMRLGKEQTQKIAEDDVKNIKHKIGDCIHISINNEDIKLCAFSYSSEKNISISDWNVNFYTNSILYSNYINNHNEFINKIMNKKAFKFRIVNLSGDKTNINSVKKILGNYGDDLNLTYDSKNYTQITRLPNNGNIINIVLLDESDKQAYYDTKEFFLTYKMPFQHIRMNGKFQVNPAIQQMLLLEIYKKTHPNDFYLMPDHFLQESIAGFLYLDADFIHNTLNNRYFNYLTTSYIFSENMDYSEENIIANMNVNIHVKRDYMNIMDTGRVVESILSGNEVINKFRNEGKYFNILVTKKLNKRSMESLINALKNNGISINKVYYVSNSKLRFVDNFNYYNNNRGSEHYYKIIGQNMAVIKLATQQFLYPQLFSTFVEILYPPRSQISIEDLKNIIWLSKKRTYRLFSMKNMTQLEPVVIKDKNKQFITSIKGSVNINYLI